MFLYLQPLYGESRSAIEKKGLQDIDVIRIFAILKTTIVL